MTDITGRPELEAFTGLLRLHPAVADALVTAGSGGAGPTVWIVPDPDTAPLLHRAARIEDEGRLAGLGWHEPAPGFQVAGLNRVETDFLYREIFVDGSYLRSSASLPPDAVVVDIGANIGMFALRVALLHPRARVVAVEPVADVAAAIRLNAELYGTDIITMCAAVGEAESETDFTFYRHNSVMSGRFADEAEDAAVLKAYVLTGPGSADPQRLDRVVAERLVPERRRVPVTTLTSLAERHRLDRIDLLKVDAEKSEWEVLAGIAPELWPRIDRVAMEVHDIGGRLAAVLGLLRRQGFTVSSDQDPRLVHTPCHAVYAYRPEAVSDVATEASPELRPGTGPTRRELERDVQRLFTDQFPETDGPVSVVMVPDLARSQAAGPAPTASSPGTGRTAVLVEAWETLFGPGSARPGADFFELGGTSMLALRLMDLVERHLGEGTLTPDVIFGEATFDALASTIEASRPTPVANPTR